MSSGEGSQGILRRFLRWVRPSEREPVARTPAGSDRRREVRVPVELRVALRFETVHDVVHSRTVNVSQGGMFIRTRQPRAEGTRVKIQMEVGGRAVELAGIVVHKVAVAEAGRHPPGMGIQFVGLSAEAQAFVDELWLSAEG